MIPAFAEPKIEDRTLHVENFTGDIYQPVSMSFVGNDILVLQRTTGQVRLIQNGTLQDAPVLDLSVANDGERGLLGITTVGKYVYLYYTAADKDGGKAIENRIARYVWDGRQLVNAVLLKTLPSDAPYHNGGAMTSFKGQVFAVIGDNGNYGRLQNRPFEWKNDTSVILQVEPPGPYYAIGIRNSFGLAVDPLTGNLWDTENGPDVNDEINFVPQNFNSGWIEIMGPAESQAKIDSLPKYGNYRYGDPEFTWHKPVAPTAILFFNSSVIGKYDNHILVGDCNDGIIYKFKLNSQRTGFEFDTPQLSDMVLNEGDPKDEIVFGRDFGCVTDMKQGPDGMLYVVSLSYGKIFRIIPTAFAQDRTLENRQGGGCLIATAAYGTELASGVQALRETRYQLMQTGHGSLFFRIVEPIYYSFSPQIADLQRQNSAFKEATRIALTPLILSVTVLQNVDSDLQFVSGGSMIFLSVAAYILGSVLIITKLKNILRSRFF